MTGRARNCRITPAPDAARTRLNKVGRQLDPVEAPRAQIFGRDPELIDAFAEMVAEAVVRRKLEQQQMRLRAFPLIALHVDRRREHAIRGDRSSSQGTL